MFAHPDNARLLADNTSRLTDRQLVSDYLGKDRYL